MKTNFNPIPGRFLLVIFATLFAFSFNMQGQSLNKVKAKVVKSTFIYEKADFPQCHASTIVETDDGMLAAWFGGTNESNSDVCIYTARYKKGVWSKPVLAADGIMNSTLRYPCWNPVLFRRNNGDIILYYKVGPNPRKWWGAYKISSDNGQTWSKYSNIPSGFLGPIKDKPVQLSDNRILCPSSVEVTPDNWMIHLETTDQDLHNWTKINVAKNGFNVIQPTVLFHGEDTLQLLCRSQNKVIATSWSYDKGANWTAIESSGLPNNNAGIDAVTCSNGLHLLIYNPITEGRNKLAVAFSSNGRDWKHLITLEDHNEGEFSYPAIIQDSKGLIHITYTYNRVKIKYVCLKLKY